MAEVARRNGCVVANFKYYERDGLKYRRVTSVLDYFNCPELVRWKVRVGVKEAGRISKEALKIGSRVDGLCETDWRDGTYSLKKSDSPAVLNCMKAWEAWKRDYADVFADIKAMQTVHWHDDWRVAGTSDILTGHAVLDIKTSKRIALPYWIQTAVYNRDAGLDTAYILRLDKELGIYEFVKRPDEYSQDYLETLFVGILNAYNYFNETEIREEN